MTAPVLTAPEDLEGWLSDPGRVNASVQDGTFAANLRAYAANNKAANDRAQLELREQIQAGIADFLKEGKAGGGPARLSLAPDDGPPRYAKLHNKRAAGAALDGLFPDIGSYLQATWNHSSKYGTRNADIDAKLDKIRNYQEKVPSEGGFLVPEEFRAELLRLSLETAVVRPRARVVPMGSRTLTYPTVDETSRVSSVFGGIIVYRTEEGAELTESASAFGGIKLEATKQTALAHVTNELLRDAAGGFGQYIEETFPMAISAAEDADFISGTGVGEPLGGLSTGNTAMVVVSKEIGQAADTIEWKNITKMFSRMLPDSLERAVWVVTPDAFPELAELSVQVGTGGSVVWLPDATGTPRLNLLGRPVIMSSRTPGILGDQGDISFVDWSYYLIGDRQTMTVDSSEHVKFTSDKTTFRVIQRNDGQPWIKSPLTPENNGPTQSPFVQIEAR